MANLPETKVVISGDAAGALNAIAKTRKALSGAKSEMEGAVRPLTDALSAMTEWAGQVTTLARSLGNSSEKASAMAVAMRRLGIESDVVVSASGKIAEKLANNAERFTELGVRTRNLATGELRPLGEIMAETNAKIAAQGTATAQAIAGTKIYGESWSTVKTTLKLTGQALDDAAVQANAFHLLIGPDGAAMTKAYNEQQRELGLVWQSIQVQLGTQVLPTMIKVGEFFNSGGPASAKIFSTALAGLSLAMAGVWTGTRQVGNALGGLAAAAAMAIKGRFTEAREILQQARADNVELGQSFNALAEKFGQPVAAEKDAAAKRKAISEDLQRAQAELETLRAIKSGKASAQTAIDDTAATKTKLENLEKLREALRSAWQTTVQDAQKAGEASTTALKNAAKIRQEGQQSAADIRRSTMSAEDQAFLAQRDARNAADEATANALYAKMAAQHGRAKNAEALADKALRDAETARKAADKIADPEDRAKAIERISEAQAMAEEAKAKNEEARKQALEEQAAGQANTLNELEAQIKAISEAATKIPVDLQISEALANVASLKAELDSLQDKTVTVTVNTVQTGDGGSTVTAGEPVATFAQGGYTGRGARLAAAGIVHRGEYVLPQDVVRQPGMLGFLEHLRRYGASALPGFADGGLVGRLALPTIRPPSPAPTMRPVTLVMPGGSSYGAAMGAGDVARLQQDIFARAALAKGGAR